MADCRVFFRDRTGVEHVVRLDAENRYIAFGMAMHRLKQARCCALDYSELQKLTVQVMNGFKVKYALVVTREQFEQWLGPPNNLRMDRKRQYLQMLLGRMEPDRDFKRGLTER